MNKTVYIFPLILLIIVLFSACQSEKDFQKQLNGTDWTTSHFSVVMPTHKNSDSTSTISANESNWAEVMKASPSKLYFNNDGSYKEDFFNINGEITITYEGTWETVGDSIIFSVEKPQSFKQTHLIGLDEATSELKLSKVGDFDRDKQIDDLQTFTYKRQ